MNYQPPVVVYSNHSSDDEPRSLPAQPIETRGMYTTTNLELGPTKPKIDCCAWRHVDLITCAKWYYSITIGVSLICLIIAIILLSIRGVDTIQNFGTFWASIILLVVTVSCWGIAIGACFCGCWCS